MRAPLVSLFLLLAIPPATEAATSMTKGGRILGQVGVGTETPFARFEVQFSSADVYGLKVSSPDGSSMLVVDRFGRVGVGVSTPTAYLDVRGAADDGTVALQLRIGNSTTSLSASQILFAYNSSNTFRHAIKTQVDSSQFQNNRMLFFLWRSTGQSDAVGSTHVLGLEAMASVSSASVHVLPAGVPDAELEVSNGSSTGGGTIHRVAAGTHSSARLKSDIAHLDASAEQTAFNDVISLRHARFRYRALRGGVLHDDQGQPELRGLIFEDTPESIHGPTGTVILDYRILNAELALKEVVRRIKTLENEISALERR